MVSVNLNPAPRFHLLDPMNMGLPGLNTIPSTTMPIVAPSSVTPASNSLSMPSTTATNGVPTVPEDPNKKVRKPYTITKSRENWTEQEHEKFLEALQLFDRDWKKIAAIVGSKTVIQIRSHAQKYFLKVQKSGTSEHVPPPRPKRKASYPYPQKAPKVPLVSQVTASEAYSEPAYIFRPDSSAALGSPVTNASSSSWSYNITPVNVPQPTTDDQSLVKQAIVNNCCFGSSNKSTPSSRPNGQRLDQGNLDKPMGVMPDFAQVYSFIGSVFDPNVTGQLQRLKKMDPINMETILLLMRNLCVNLMCPEFEDDRRLLSSFDPDFEKANSGSPLSNSNSDKSNTVVLSA